MDQSGQIPRMQELSSTEADEGRNGGSPYERTESHSSLTSEEDSFSDDAFNN